MPELPEVETTVRGLNKKIIGKKIKDVWTDWPKYFKKGPKRANHISKSEKEFLLCVKGEEIVGVRRIGKNIIIELSNEKALLIHQKMSGHLLVGRWKRVDGDFDAPSEVSEKWEDETWVPNTDYESHLWNEKNRFIRLIFFLDDGEMLALSNLRRFAKVLCGGKREILELPDIVELGPDPLSPDFNVDDFKNLFVGRRGRIKSLLLNQKFLSGVGNIYSDEILWRVRVHPLTAADRLKEKDLENMYDALVDVLKKAVQLEGTSIDDYRRPDGVKGGFEKELDVYFQEGKECPRCGDEIERIKVGSRSARLCPTCQSQV